MRLDDILNVTSTHPQDITKFDRDNARHVGDYERHPIFLSVAKTDTNTKIYEIRHRDTDEMVAFVVGASNPKWFAISHAETKREYQKRGFITALYRFLRDKMHLNVISDKRQTPGGKNIWMSLANQSGRVWVYDTLTKDKFAARSFDMKKVYVDGSEDSEESERYRLIFESHTILEIPEVPGDIINRYTLNSCIEYV